MKLGNFCKNKIPLVLDLHNFGSRTLQTGEENQNYFIREFSQIAVVLSGNTFGGNYSLA